MEEELYNLKHTNTKPFKLYFVSKVTRKAMRFNSPCKFEYDRVKLESIKLMLNELGITVVPYEKLYSDFDPVNLDETINYPRGLSGYLPDSKEPIIAIKPTSDFKQFVLFHEIAHILLEHNDLELSHEEKELEANVVSFLVINEINEPDVLINIIRCFNLQLVNIPFDSCIKCMDVADKILTTLKDCILYDFWQL